MIGRAISRAEALRIAPRTLERAESERVGRRMDVSDDGLFERNLARKYKYTRKMLRMTERENEILIEHGLRMIRKIQELHCQLESGADYGQYVLGMARGVSLIHDRDGMWRLTVASNGVTESAEGETPWRVFAKADAVGLKWREEDVRG